MPPAPDLQGQHALHHLYSEHRAWLHTWLRRHLQCTADAADLTQDVFVRVLRSRQAERIDEPRAFLTTLARRTLFTFWRRREIEQAYVEAVQHLPEALAPSAEQQAQAREAIEALDRLLGGLPPPVRQVFLFSRLDGMTHVDIARATGLSLATVERHMKRAYLHCWRLAPLDEAI
jgi:RNA polymerase sigma factor (sigma-70 family)